MSRSHHPDTTRQVRVSPTAPDSKSLNAAVWEHMEAQPGFNERIDQGHAQIAKGDKVSLSEVLRRR